MDLAKLNTGELVMLMKDNVTVQFAPGKWSLMSKPIGARPRKQELFWVRTTRIAKRYSIRERNQT